MAITPVFTTVDSVNGGVRSREHDALKITDAEISAGVTPVNYAYETAPSVIQRLGGNGDGSTDNLTPITNAKTVSGASYFPRGTYRISDNLTLDAAYAPIFEKLAVWKPDANKTISIAGPIAAGNHQIFDLSNSGASVTIVNQVVNATWFGVIADGNFATGAGTDNSAVLQKAVSALATAGGGALYVPPGIYKLSSQVTIPDGVTVYGAGKWSSIFFAPSAFSNLGGLVRITGSNGYPTCFHGISILGQQRGAGGNGLVSVKNGVFISDIWVSAFTAHVGITISQTDNFLFDFLAELNSYGIHCTETHNNISNGSTYGNTSGGVLIANGSAGENGRVTVSNVRSSAETVSGFVISAGKRVTITGCSAIHNDNSKYTTAGLEIDASNDVVVQGFHGFLGTTSATGAGIYVHGSSTNIQISGGGSKGFQDGVSSSSTTTLNISGGIHSGNGRHGVNVQGGDLALVTGVSANSNGMDGIMCNASAAGSKLAIVGNSCNNNSSHGITATAAATSFINMVGNTAVGNTTSGFNKTGTVANINDVGNF